MHRHGSRDEASGSHGAGIGRFRVTRSLSATGGLMAVRNSRLLLRLRVVIRNMPAGGRATCILTLRSARVREHGDDREPSNKQGEEDALNHGVNVARPNPTLNRQPSGFGNRLTESSENTQRTVVGDKRLRRPPHFDGWTLIQNGADPKSSGYSPDRGRIGRRRANRFRCFPLFSCSKHPPGVQRASSASFAFI
jgi:hypothetical protein